MSCLRCGKESPAEQYFCEVCLQDMAQHPVHPNAAVHLPKRIEEVPPKKTAKKKKQIKPEDQILHLKRILRSMTVLLVIACTLMCIAIGTMISREQDALRPDGKNYITATDTNIP